METSPYWRTTGSVLGPLLFNIYICDLFLFMSESNLANYADDTTLYECEKQLCSNQILNLGSLKTVHVICASYILHT